MGVNLIVNSKPVGHSCLTYTYLPLFKFKTSGQGFLHVNEFEISHNPVPLHSTPARVFHEAILKFGLSNNFKNTKLQLKLLLIYSKLAQKMKWKLYKSICIFELIKFGILKIEILITKMQIK